MSITRSNKYCTHYANATLKSIFWSSAYFSLILSFYLFCCRPLELAIAKRTTESPGRRRPVEAIRAIFRTQLCSWYSMIQFRNQLNPLLSIHSWSSSQHLLQSAATTWRLQYDLLSATSALQLLAHRIDGENNLPYTAEKNAFFNDNNRKSETRVHYYQWLWYITQNSN